VRGFLTIEPFRGDQVAAGAVALTVLVWLVDFRLQEDVADGGRVALVAVACAFLTLLGWRSPREPSSPRGYQVALYVCAWSLALLVLLELTVLLDVDLEATTVTWVAGASFLVAAAWARAKDTATLTLVGAAAGVVTVVAAAHALGDPSSGTVRWLLFGCSVVLTFAVLSRRDRRPAHAAQLANVGGLTVAAILATGLEDLLLLAFGGDGEDVTFHLGTGWELLGLAAGLGLIAYGAVDEHRGPVGIGVLLLALWTTELGADGGLVGWPVVLAVGAAFLLIVGLRPATPLPPQPGLPDVPDGPLPLPWRERR